MTDEIDRWWHGPAFAVLFFGPVAFFFWGIEQLLNAYAAPMLACINT
jgi:hypothetical protein